MKNLEQILVDINQQATRINRAADDHHLLIGDLEIIARESKKAIESFVLLRKTFSDYTLSEGCSCCQDKDSHKEQSETIGHVLNVDAYSDGSGRDFNKYRTNPI